MFYLEIKINDKLIIKKSAGRLEMMSGVDKEHSYLTDQSRIIKHKYSDGAIGLARKLLNEAESDGYLVE